MTKQDPDWTNILFLGGYHIALTIGLILYLRNRSPSAGLIIATIVLYILTGLSITAGYHRLFSHRSYKPNRIFELIMIFFGTMSIQGPVLPWAHNHRLHHRYVDTEKDPYSIKEGFWSAHFIWMLRKKPYDGKIVKDLEADPILRIQHKYYPVWMILTNLLAFFLVGWLVNDYWGALVFAVLLRMFAVHHSTWFINSLAHTWGVQPYSKEFSAVNNFIISLLTFGEGYHNYHHTFDNDYRNGVRWWQFDPTKLLIWSGSKIGMTKDLKKINKFVIKKKLLLEDKRMMLEALEPLKEKELKKKVEKSYSKIEKRIMKTRELEEDYYSNDKTYTRRSKFVKARKNLKKDLKEWNRLCLHVLKLNPDYHH